MQQLTHRFVSNEQLTSFIDRHRLRNERGMVQVASGVNEERIAQILKRLMRLLPEFSIIGSSTCGEIVQGQCYSNSVALQFCLFNKGTEVVVTPLDEMTTQERELNLSFLSGASPKVAIIYVNAFSVNPDTVIEHLSAANPGCCVAGGVAADNGQFQSAYTIAGDRILKAGSVCAFLYGENLHFSVDSYQGWRPIGKTFTVTKAAGNHVYELDRKPILTVYQEYMGEHIAEQFPRNVIEFPLMIRRRECFVLRAPIGYTHCQSGIKYAGTVKEGDKVSFSFADVSAILASTPEFEPQPNVCTLTFACAARRSFLRGRMSEEVERVAAKTSAIGGFFYGEFSTIEGKTELLNLSTTVLQLSEEPLKRSCKKTTQQSLPNSTQALANLASKASLEHEELLFSLQQHQRALSKSSIISVTNSMGVITYVNKKFEQVSGYGANELIGNTHSVIRHPKMKDRVFQQLWRTITAKKRWQGLLRNRRKDGSSYYVKTVIYPITDASGEIKEFVSIRNDVTDIVTARKAIQKHNIDTLTQLPNRAKLSRDLERTPVDCVAILDVKNFKVLNDYWGVNHGDFIIKAVAERLRSCCMNYSLKVYHINGAVFALRPLKPISTEAFRSQVLRIKDALELSDIVIDEHHHEINFSIGIGASSKRALAYAESAAIEAKNEHFITSIIIKTEDAQANNFYFWLEEVRLALQEERVLPYFQEVATVAENPLPNKYEALARIQLRNGEVVSPGVFLNYLKKTRYYPQLTRLMVGFAVRQSILSRCPISVNLASQDILNRETVNYITDALQGNPEAKIIFEMTETESIKDFNAMNRFIHHIRSFGAKVAIDDFGSGYSNFVYLVEMKPDYIKIDGSIIKSICTNKNSLHVARSIVDLARGLNIKTIAEFVCDRETLVTLTEIGIDYAQGYFIAEPKAEITR
ncbi:hypothetical protein CEW91_11925 [Idiomarina piscisalsi]|uniref:Diguanylate cyclase n=1 Tax=Idiomarina piscisalsi TaxID=1096243 RepID=A0ABN5ASA5_9GAMM|nr:EAL domain-containing protein [Idiomarina piscisalsi]ASG66799.1 hypothetical protein CEW91_11925 [Idiomarina piscisalsi]